MSDSVQPHRWEPTRLPRPWDSPGKNTGVCCHFLLQCMKVKSESEVAQSCPTLRDPMDCSLPGSSIHGIFQARVLDAMGMPLPSPVVFAFAVKWEKKKLLPRPGSRSFHFYFSNEFYDFMVLLFCNYQIQAQRDWLVQSYITNKVVETDHA